jgi:hypothetical protein
MRFQRVEDHFLFLAEQGFFHERTGNYQDQIREFGPSSKRPKSLRRDDGLITIIDAPS